MEKAPAFQWYPKDFLTDENVDVMTLEQRGAYITLLSKCWIEGSLPTDQTKLKAMCNHPSNWNEIWCALIPCFVENSENRFINLRLEKERKKQEEWRTKSIKGGIISGKSRREKALKGGSQMVQTKKEPNTNTSSPISSLQSSSSSASSKEKKKKREEAPDSGIESVFPVPEHADILSKDTHGVYLETKNKKRLRSKMLESFFLFWDAFDYKDGLRDAADSWLKIAWPEDRASKNKIFADIMKAARKESDCRDETIARGSTPKMAQGWLSSRRWEDEEEKDG